MFVAVKPNFVKGATYSIIIQNYVQHYFLCRTTYSNCTQTSTVLQWTTEKHYIGSCCVAPLCPVVKRSQSKFRHVSPLRRLHLEWKKARIKRKTVKGSHHLLPARRDGIIHGKLRPSGRHHGSLASFVLVDQRRLDPDSDLSQWQEKSTKRLWSPVGSLSRPI